LSGCPFGTKPASHPSQASPHFYLLHPQADSPPPRIPVPRGPLPDFYGHSGQLRFFDRDGAVHSDGHFWDAFLIDVDVGFENMEPLLAVPVEDHLLKNYIAKH